MINLSEIDVLIDSLSQTPFILSNLLRGIPKERLKEVRRPGKWTIHENVCHLAQAEEMIHHRFQLFKTDPQPTFEPYLPGDTVSDSELINLDLEDQLLTFDKSRKSTVDLLGSFEDFHWEKQATHPQYEEYNALILLRHTLMHDHFHMYRVEELWLTKKEFL